MKRSLFISLLAAGFVTLGSGTAEAKGIRLQYSDRVGETVRYKMVMDAGASEFASGQNRTSSLRTEMVVSQQVLSAKDGVARVKTRVDSGSLDADGQPMAVSAVGQEVLADMKRSGEVVHAEDFVGLDVKNMQVVFPERELDQNDSWTVKIAPTPAMPIALNVTYTVAGTEQLAGEECVKIKASVVADKGTAPAGFALDLKSEGEMFFSPRLGRMVKNDMRSRSSMIRLAGINGSDKTITRISNHIRMEALP